MESGIIRRIDDLGRIALPKEVRRQLKLHEGDPLEIVIDKGGDFIKLKRYSRTEPICNSLKNACRALGKECPGQKFYPFDDFGAAMATIPAEHASAADVVVREAFSARSIKEDGCIAVIPVVYCGEPCAAICIINEQYKDSVSQEAVKAAKIAAHLLTTLLD